MLAVRLAAGRLARAHDIGLVMILAPAALGAEVGAHQKRLAMIAGELEGVEIMLQNAPPPIGAGLGAAALTAVYQFYLCKDRDRQRCFKAFLNNIWFGGFVFVGLWFAYL